VIDLLVLVKVFAWFDIEQPLRVAILNRFTQGTPVTVRMA
jgi:hypothetical protein